YANPIDACGLVFVRMSHVRIHEDVPSLGTGHDRKEPETRRRREIHVLLAGLGYRDGIADEVLMSVEMAVKLSIARRAADPTEGSVAVHVLCENLGATGGPAGPTDHRHVIRE